MDDPEKLLKQTLETMNRLAARLNQMEEETQKARTETFVLASAVAQVLCLLALKSDNPKATVDNGLAASQAGVDLLQKDLHASQASIEAAERIMITLRSITDAGLRGISEARSERRWWQFWRSYPS